MKVLSVGCPDGLGGPVKAWDTSALIGSVGKDMNGRFLLEELHRNQVETRR